MKPLFKIILLVTNIVLMLNTTHAIANNDENPGKIVRSNNSLATLNVKQFNNDDDQAAYALGASLGRYMGNSLKEQENLGIRLDKDQVISGVQDAFSDNNQLSDADIEKTLQSFEARVRASAQVKIEETAKENEAKGIDYCKNFLKEKSVKRTKSGLLYKVEKLGTGSPPKDSDTVFVNYIGALIDGTEFDNSYSRSEALSFRLDSVIQGWAEGLKYVNKGGKIKLVIPPELAYGKIGAPGIPPNATLVFDVELLDVKATSRADLEVNPDRVKTK